LSNLVKIDGLPYWFRTKDKKWYVLRDYDVRSDTFMYKVSTGIGFLKDVSVRWFEEDEIDAERALERGRKAIEVLLQDD